MSATVFIGPSLSVSDAVCELDADYRPPVSQGDVYRATLRQPDAIGIIDGRFHDVPAVWHKEILWALTQGIAVYGGSSMGALRAVELAPFGMRGVGVVFDWFYRGVLEDDDEVAVAHGDAADGFVAVSDAMINIRVTLTAAADSGVISHELSTWLIEAGKALHYSARHYAGLISAARSAGFPPREVDELERWLRANKIDQKRADARELLRVMRDDLSAGSHAAIGTSFSFQHTQFFERARRSGGHLVSRLHADSASEGDKVTLEEVLDELRLHPELYESARERALLRCLAMRDLGPRRRGEGGDRLRRTAAAFRRQRGLAEPEDVDAWLAKNELTATQFAALMREEQALAAAAQRLQGELDIYMRSQLRVDGDYPELVARVLAKRRLLAEHGMLDPAASRSVQPDRVVDWYFTERLQRAVPADIGAYASGVGFSDIVIFLRAITLEYLAERLDGPEMSARRDEALA